jgi:cytochrome bd-type quinol oxidase subunit 1
MPGALDYLAIISVFSLGISFITTVLTIGIIAIIKKNKKPFQKYLVLWLKVFVIVFVCLVLTGFLIFVGI